MSRTLEDHLKPSGKKRVLAIDGGGARGILACGMLKRVETILRDRQPIEQREGFRLHHYFDVIGGTSTGSILAAGLAIGLSVDDLRKLYLNLCPKIFKKRSNGARIPKFEAEVLADQLARVLRETNGKALPLKLSGAAVEGSPILLGSPALKTGFAVFAKRINTGGLWALTNHPNWRYYDDAAQKRYCERMGAEYFHSPDNKGFALAQLVQASAAAPTYFASVGMKADSIKRSSRGVKIKKVSDVPPPDGVFVDGALSGRNTPAMQMLFMLRHPAFGYEWQTTHKNENGETEEDLLMLSVGTGWWRPRVTDDILDLTGISRLVPEATRAISTLQTMIHDSSLNSLQWLQSMSRYPLEPHKRWKIDGEVDWLTMEGGAPFLIANEPLLRFRRLDVRLEDDDIEAALGDSLEKAGKALDMLPRMRGGERRQFNELGKAWGQSPYVMRMRELSEYDPDALRLMYEVGARHAEKSIDDDDFPTAFDPDYAGGPSAEESVTVVD